MDTKDRDFVSFLDDPAGGAPVLLSDDDDVVILADDKLPAAPTIPFDYLSVADELHSGRITLQPDRRKGGPRDLEAGYRAELEAYLDAATIEPSASPLAETLAMIEPLPSIEPEDVAFELGLAHIPATDYPKLRRRFAFDNHPDRVAPHLRERAMVRMKLANMLIDAASSKAKAGRD